MPDGAQNQNSVDRVVVLPQAEIPFTYELKGGPAGSVFSTVDGYSLVFFAFGFEGISNWAAGYSTREQVMQSVLDFLGGNTATDVEDINSDLFLPREFTLEQNYPNPFNPSTLIHYSVSPRSAGQPLTFEIYNILGQKTAELLNGPAVAGNYQLQVDAAGWPSGVYFYRLTVGHESQTRKMLLIK
jgi:hypothetical protein